MRAENNEAVQEKKKTKKKGRFSDDDDNESIESVSDDEFDKYLGKWTSRNACVCLFADESLFWLDQFMGDVDQDEIDLDEGESKNGKDDADDDVQDIARFVYLIRMRIN